MRKIFVYSNISLEIPRDSLNPYFEICVFCAEAQNQ